MLYEGRMKIFKFLELMQAEIKKLKIFKFFLHYYIKKKQTNMVTD